MKKTISIFCLLLLVTAAALAQKNDPFTLQTAQGYSGYTQGTSLNLKRDTTHFPLVVSVSGASKKTAANFKTADSFTIYDSLETIKELAKFLFGQKAAVYHKPDTVKVPYPIYVYDITDTVQAKILYKKSEKSDRIYQTNGYALVRGFKAMQNGEPVWVEKPQIIGALDNKKNSIKHPIQTL